MSASLLVESSPLRGFPDLPPPAPLADGSEPEARVIVCGLDWRRYLAFDQVLGDDRPGPRLYYVDGSVEIVTTSSEHERLREWIGGFMDLYFDRFGTRVFHRGQATMRDATGETGAEPDKSWCLGSEKEFPDIVLEIALTSGGLDKLDVYRRFQVPEVWIWRKRKLELHLLRDDGSGYEAAPRSRLLPELDPALITRCLAFPEALEARRAFRAGLEGA